MGFASAIRMRNFAIWTFRRPNRWDIFALNVNGFAQTPRLPNLQRGADKTPNPDEGGVSKSYGPGSIWLGRALLSKILRNPTGAA